jgi:hypothetical protein
MFRAKQFELLLVVFFALGTAAEAQSRLNFPRQLSANELSTTGFALVNTSSASVAATFNFYGTNGSLVTQSIQNVPAKGQLARLASEIFPSLNAAGWVQIVSSSTEVQGFEIVGNFLTVVDGAGPAVEGRQLALIDFSREDIVHVVNTTAQAGTVQITLNNAAGEVLGVRAIPLTPFQPASLRLGDVNNDNNIDLVSISADVNVSAALTTQLPGGLDIGLTNAILTSGAPSTLFFPFAPNGPQGTSNWTTYLGISNLASTSQSVSLTFTPDAGPPVTIERNLPPSASIGDTVANLFATPSSPFTPGWIRVMGSGALTGVAAYQDSASGSLAIVPSQSSGAGAFFFGHIASLAPWYTGIALLNTSTTAANVEVYAIDSSGQLVGSVASFSLSAGRRTSLLSEFVPQVLQRPADGGWVFVRSTNNVPLLGFELFGHAVIPILANVQGFALPPTSTFTPPGGTGGAVMTIDQVTVTDSNNAVKTQFAPRDNIILHGTVTNSGSSVSGQLTYSVTDPRSQTLYTNSLAVTIPPATTDVSVGTFIPTNALNGSYTLTVSLVYQGQTSTKSGTFTVAGGTNTPSVGQEITIATGTSDALQLSYRPGDAVRFVVPTANFTSDAVSAVLNYQLVGPGALNVASGSTSYTIPTGIGFKTIELQIPQTAQEGLFVFTSTLTFSGTTSAKGTVITVVPKSSLESISVDQVYVSDTGGVPRGGFTPGSNVLLNGLRMSTFGVSTSATVRYTLTGPNAAVVFDQPVTASLSNGGSFASLPFNIGANAASGTYTFQLTISYQDNNSVAKTSTASTTFMVGNNPPALAPTVTTPRVYVADYNGIARTTFSVGEPLALARTSYSTITSPSTGTLVYQLSVGSTILTGQSIDVTFPPGLSGSLTPPAVYDVPVPSGTVFTFTVTATGPGVQPSMNSSSFTITSPSAPPPPPAVSVIESKAMSPVN